MNVLRKHTYKDLYISLYSTNYGFMTHKNSEVSLIQIAAVDKENKLYLVDPKSGPVAGKIHVPQEVVSGYIDVDDAVPHAENLIWLMGYCVGYSPKIKIGPEVTDFEVDNIVSTGELDYLGRKIGDVFVEELDENYLVKEDPSNKDTKILRFYIDSIKLPEAVIPRPQLIGDTNKNYDVIGWLNPEGVQSIYKDAISPAISHILQKEEAIQKIRRVA